MIVKSHLCQRLTRKPIGTTVPSLPHSLALPFFRGRFAGLGARLTLPRPDDAPWAHAPGVDPDRILIFGNGEAVGWGVRSHDLALPGHLARSVSMRTGRGTDVDVLADPTMTITSAAAALPLSRLGAYDAIVVVLGLSDALRMTSVARYRESLAAVLARAIAHRHDGAEIVVLEIDRPSTLSLFDITPGSILDEHADRLNAEAADLCDELPGVRFVALPHGQASDAHTAPPKSSDVYRAVADMLAARLRAPLDEQFAAGREICPLRDSPQTESERLGVIYDLGILDSQRERRFDDIVERARILLAATGAAFSIVGPDRVWNKAIAGAYASEIPLRGAMCAETIKGSGPFIVPDLWADDRFVTHPAARFYAGYPIEGPGGIRVGALCVIDSRPRPADSVDLVLLRELALAVQREVALGTVPAVTA